MSAKPLNEIAPVNDYFGYDDSDPTGYVGLHARRFSFLNACETVYQARMAMGKQFLVGFAICNFLSFPFGFFWQAWLVLMVLFGSIYFYVLRNKTKEVLIQVDPQVGIIEATGLKIGATAIDWSDIRAISVLAGHNKAYFSRWFGKPKTQSICAVLLELDVSDLANARGLGRKIRLLDGVDPRTAQTVAEELMEMQAQAFRAAHSEIAPSGAIFNL